MLRRVLGKTAELPDEADAVLALSEEQQARLYQAEALAKVKWQRETTLAES